MPGYICEEGMEFFDPAMTHRWLRVIGDEMALAGDDNLQRQLNGELPRDTVLSPIPSRIQELMRLDPDLRINT